MRELIKFMAENLGLINEAKGLMQRNRIENIKFKYGFYPYFSSQFYTIENDRFLVEVVSPTHFGPVSRPHQNYLTLPQEIQVEWISQESDILKLEPLLSEKYIGVDSEWRI